MSVTREVKARLLCLSCRNNSSVAGPMISYLTIYTHGCGKLKQVKKFTVGIDLKARSSRPLPRHFRRLLVLPLHLPKPTPIRPPLRHRQLHSDSRHIQGVLRAFIPVESSLAEPRIHGIKLHDRLRFRLLDCQSVRSGFADAIGN